MLRQDTERFYRKEICLGTLMEYAAQVALIGWGRGKALFVARLGKSILLLTAASARRTYSVG